MSILDAKIPAGPLKDKWSAHKAHIGVVSPANKKKLDVIVVGTGLAGGSAAASLAELGYNVTAFCYQDSPRRHTLSPPREVSTQPKTIRTTMTLSSGYFMKPSKEVTIAPAKPMYTAWRK